MAADLAAYTPTIRHAWRAPAEETWQTFAWYGLASALVLAVAPLGFLSSAYTAYLAVFDTSAGALILARRRSAAAADVLTRPVAGPLPPGDGLRWFERPEWHAALRRDRLDRPYAAPLPPGDDLCWPEPADWYEARERDRDTWLCIAHRMGWCRECARHPRPWLRRPLPAVPGALRCLRPDPGGP